MGRDYLNTPDAQDERNEHGYIVAEGVTRVLALASIRLPSLGINGSFGWRGKNRSEGGTAPLPDWEAVAVKGQPFVIALDGDVATNPDVHSAGARLSQWLMGKGARSVSFILLPVHLGLDDWIAEQRAAGLDDEAIRRELSALRGDLPARPIRRPAIVTTHDDDESPTMEVSDWIAFGEWWNQRHGRRRWVYSNDPAALGWWAYIGNVWRPLLTTDPRMLDQLARYRYRYAHELATGGQRDLAELLAGKEFTAMVKQGAHADMWVGLRHACAGDIPSPEPHYVGVPSGIVDLRDGSIRPHAPEYGIRALTAGDFSDDDAAHKWALAARFDKVFDDENLASYIRLAALSLTGLAQSFRSIVMVTGSSGSGKGGAVNVLVRAFGGRAMAAGAEWLAMRDRSEIDAIAADVLERQPAVLSIDEVGGDGAHINPGRLLSLTGNTAWSYRRPHGTLLTGSPRFQLWTTAVQPPAIDARSGIERRLAVLRTKGRLLESEIDELGGHSPDLLDAVVSLACKQAAEVYRKGEYRAPEGSRSAKAETLADMDEVAAWLEEVDDLDNVSMADGRQRACQALELPHDAVTPTAFGLRVNGSTKWERARGTKGARYIKRRNAWLDGMADGSG